MGVPLPICVRLSVCVLLTWEVEAESKAFLCPSVFVCLCLSYLRGRLRLGGGRVFDPTQHRFEARRRALRKSLASPTRELQLERSDSYDYSRL